MNQVNAESIDLQTFNLQLESENQRLSLHVDSLEESLTLKSQQVETLQLQIEHQTSQFKELQQDFSDVIEQLQKKESVLNVKFSQEELQEAADYLLTRIQLDDISERQKQNQLEGGNQEDQTITCLIVKAAEKIKFLNRFIEGFRIEMEETTERYDKLVIENGDAL